MSNNLVSTTGAFSFSWEEGVCVVTWDEPGKSVNAFSVPIIQDLEAIVDAVLARPDLRGLVITSGKEKCFAAGVDVSIFESLTTFEDSEKGALQMQAIFNKLERAKVPTVAAVNGVCLGGAFELVLACQYRLVSSDPSTKLGAPETKLGIIPGAGGTQRLPRMIGIIPALDLILSGRQLDGKKAFKAGIVNGCVPRSQLVTLAKQLATSASMQRSMALKPPRRLMLENSPVGRAFIRRSTTKTLMKTTKGKYPALFKALDAVLCGITMSLDDGLRQEAKLFAECVTTAESRALVHLFRVMTAAKKDPTPEAAQQKAKELWLDALESGDEAVGILGAGLMGSGIATVLAAEGYRSVMLDSQGAGLERGMARVKDHFNALVKKRRRTARERDLAVMRVSPTLQKQTLKGSPFIVEAVFEDLGVKGEMLRSCEALHSERLVFASNTSSLPISDIAKMARDPGGVVGMHFFSPVPKMPLVEIIQTPHTRPEVLSATFRLAQAMGKTNIVVNDGPGFYTTRVLGFLLAEAMNLLVEGNSIEAIDKAMEGFGWPVGPMNLMDEIGIDVGVHVLDTLTAAFGDRIKAPSTIAEFVKQNRLGRKTEKGFYTYKDGKRVGPDSEVYRLLGVVPHTDGMSAEAIAERCTAVFVIEAARCLQEGILRSADDGDLGAIFGLGFPPFLGGPFEYVRQMGKDRFVVTATALAEKHGLRYDPKVFSAIKF